MPEADGAILEVDGLDVWYGRRQVLHGVSLRLGARECLAVIGPNGAGKTTLARTLAGVGGRASGAVAVAGTSIAGRRADQVVHAGLALVPERGGMFRSMSVRDNLLLAREYAGRRMGLSEEEVLAECYGLFPILEERESQEAGTLSGGERRMLLISKALLAGPRVLVLDEPSLGLSPRLTSEVILDMIPKLLERDVSVLLIEQNARLALRAARRAMVLEQGRVALEGASADLAESTAIKEVYIGG